MTKVYSRKNLSEKLEVSGQTINAWTNSGLIYPNVYAAVGTGKIRLYDLHNLIECYLIKYFQNQRIELEMIKRILDAIRKYNQKNRDRKPNFFDTENFDFIYSEYKLVKGKIETEVRSGEEFPLGIPWPTMDDRQYTTIINLGLAKRFAKQKIIESSFMEIAEDAGKPKIEID